MVNDGECNAIIYYDERCNFDGSDCCPFPHQIGDGICDIENNIGICNFDGGDCCLWSLVGNDLCNEFERNNNRMCDHDGNDCCEGNWAVYCKKNCQCIVEDIIVPFDPCPSYEKIGDGICNDENNNHICNYDGGDCCKEDIDTSMCHLCNCFHGYDQKNLTVQDSCPNLATIGNGYCDSENNHPICNFDNGDCCPNADLMGNGQCDYANYNHVCQFDGGDCCYRYDHQMFMFYAYIPILDHRYDHIIGDSQCSYFHNLKMCNFDGGDCCKYSRIGDGTCDDMNNNALCNFDGGDCCFGNKNTSRCSLCNCVEVFNVISNLSTSNFMNRVKKVFFRFMEMSHLIILLYLMENMKIILLKL